MNKLYSLLFISIFTGLFAGCHFSNSPALAQTDSAGVPPVVETSNKSPERAALEQAIEKFIRSFENRDRESLLQTVTVAPDSFKRKSSEEKRKFMAEKGEVYTESLPDPTKYEEGPSRFPKDAEGMLALAIDKYMYEKIDPRKPLNVISIENTIDEGRVILQFGHNPNEFFEYQLLFANTGGEWKFFHFGYEQFWTKTYGMPELPN